MLLPGYFYCCCFRWRMGRSFKLFPSVNSWKWKLFCVRGANAAKAIAKIYFHSMEFVGLAYAHEISFQIEFKLIFSFNLSMWLHIKAFAWRLFKVLSCVNFEFSAKNPFALQPHPESFWFFSLLSIKCHKLCVHASRLCWSWINYCYSKPPPLHIKENKLLFSSSRFSLLFSLNTVLPRKDEEKRKEHNLLIHFLEWKFNCS